MGKKNVENWFKGIKSRLAENKFLWRPFFVLTGIYLLGILAIIIANVHYADDIARTNFGYTGWNGFSRYLSTVLSFGLHADGYLTNIAPLPQIIAVVISALAGMIVIIVIGGKEVFRGGFSKWGWYLVAIVPLGLSPYMLECMAYQYDAPYMALSVLFAVLPILFVEKKWWQYGVMILVGVLVVCMTYQAAIGIFPMMVIIVAMKQWSRKEKSGKEIVKFLLFSAAVFLVALLIFDKLLMKPRDSYVSNSLPAFESFFTDLYAHLKQYFELVVSDFKVLWKVLIALIGLGFVVFYAKESRRNKIGSLVVGVVGMVFIVGFSFAFYAALDKPLYATRAMYPLGVAIGIMGVYVMLAKGKWAVLKWPVFVLSWCFFVFAFTFGNALREQEDYNAMIVDMVISDLNEMPMMLKDGQKYIKTSGNLGFSPVLWHMPDDYKILRRLMMPSYSEYIPWMASRVTEQTGMPNLVFVEDRKIEDMELPVVKETVYYDILSDGVNVLVRFKDDRRFNVVF